MLTRKGEATKARILEAAARLVVEQGVERTNLEDVMAASGTSKSQLFHYFPEGKAELMGAVRGREAERVIEDQMPCLGSMTTWAAWDEWAELLLGLYRPKLNGCALTALSADASVGNREVVTVMFDRWIGALRGGLETMQREGLVAQDADPEALALASLATFQGGVVLMMATGQVSALEAAVAAMLRHVRSFAA